MKPTLKKMVCLAKSRKIGGICFAGKEIFENNTVGSWIRPVSARGSEAISPSECQYENGGKPYLFDIIDIPVIKHKPTYHQCENYLINTEYYWSKETVFPRKYLAQLLDHPNTLWAPHDSSFYGLNDRVSELYICDLKDSLYLISPSSLAIEVKIEGAEFGNPKRKVRARFRYNSILYIFPITDPDIEKFYSGKSEGQYQIKIPEGQIFLCVSIGLPYEGYCYKFVASILK